LDREVDLGKGSRLVLEKGENSIYMYILTTLTLASGKGTVEAHSIGSLTIPKDKAKDVGAALMEEGCSGV
jgi:hypothetical protein